MDVSIINKDKAGIVVLNGDLDYQSYKDLESAVENAFGSSTDLLVLDLSEVPYIDSVGLGTIAKLWKNATQQGQQFVLAGPRKNVRNMIKLVNLDGRIKLFDDVDAALA